MEEAATAQALNRPARGAQSPPSGTAAPYVRVDGLSKSFGAFVALREVSFSVYPGEFVCLLGPSGCGKTTLLRAIAGLEPQSAGQIELGGRDVSRLPPAKRNFGIVFQSYALFPNLTIRDNVAYGLVARRDPRAQIAQRVRELLDLVDLASEIDKYPSQLSGGQQQRVALARALATSPALLLLDEPLSALDAQVRVYLRDELRALQKRIGVTTILVTHDQEEALAVADRVLLMREGCIEQIGTPREIYDNPATEFVMRFVGASTALPARCIGPDRVRVEGLELDAATPANAAADAPLKVYVRPEDVQLVAAGDAGRNVVDTRVRTMTFKGSHWRMLLELAGAAPHALLADLPADLMREAPVAAGDALRVRLPADRLRAFAAA